MVIVALSLMVYSLSQTDSSSLGRWLQAYRPTIHAEQAYRPPTDNEAERFLQDFEQALEGEIDFTHLSELGYSAKSGHDEPSGKSYILLENEYDTERSWGAYLIETSRKPQHIIAAPHPRADIGSERLALALWRETPGAIYMISGSHRRAANKQGDVTRHTDSLFHKVSAYLMNEGLSQTQIHGFGDTSSPEEDIIVSSAATPVKDTHRSIVAELQDTTSLRIGTNWHGKNEPLRGAPNQQAKVAKARKNKAPFIHIEINRSTRSDAKMLQKVLLAIAKGLGN